MEIIIVGQRQGVSVSRPVQNWDDAIALLFSAVTRQPRVAVIDEFPFLVKASPSLPSSHLAELVDRARRSHERVVLTEHGQPAAVLISVDDLDELQRFQDDSDIALCEAINARHEPGVPHDQFMASLPEGSGTSPLACTGGRCTGED